jgi:hypothetical protein
MEVTMVTEVESRNALRALIRESKRIRSDGERYPQLLDYAEAYAREGIKMEGDDLRTQIAYVLSNCNNWRGFEAHRVKWILRNFLKQVQS